MRLLFAEKQKIHNPAEKVTFVKLKSCVRVDDHKQGLKFWYEILTAAARHQKETGREKDILQVPRKPHDKRRLEQHI